MPVMKDIFNNLVIAEIFIIALHESLNLGVQQKYRY